MHSLLLLPARSAEWAEKTSAILGASISALLQR